MADNYLEKRAEELRNPRPKVVRNRSYRGYDNARTVTKADLLKLQVPDLLL